MFTKRSTTAPLRERRISCCEGAYGDFAFDVATRTITLDYNERRMESDNSQHVF